MLRVHEARNTLESDLAERCDHDDGKDEDAKWFESYYILASVHLKCHKLYGSD
jgi:hypothetical protein